MSTNSMIFLIVWTTLTLVVPFVFRKRGVQECQTISTGFGILGTFLGIAYGLFHFDVNNIEKAVPELLNGLRFAFITSIVGLSWSLLISFFSKFLRFDLAQGESKEKNDHELFVGILEELQLLNKNISGDADTTLVTQIQKMRIDTNDNISELKKKFIEFGTYMIESDKSTDIHSEIKKISEYIQSDNENCLVKKIENMHNGINDNQVKLQNAFNEFASQMAENNIQALVEAVNKVMEDFNTQINDRLGDNFKKLNEGVGKLLEWQNSYKQHIEIIETSLSQLTSTANASVELLNNSSNMINTSSESLSQFVDQAKAFNETANQLKEIIDILGGSMAGFKHLAETLGQDGESIRNEMRTITEDNMRALGENLVGISQALVNDYKQLQNTIREIVANRND